MDALHPLGNRRLQLQTLLGGINQGSEDLIEHLGAARELGPAAPAMVPPLRAALALHCPVTGAVALHLLLRAVEADPGVAPALAPKLPVLLPRESPPPPRIPPPPPTGRRRSTSSAAGEPGWN